MSGKCDFCGELMRQDNCNVIYDNPTDTLDNEDTIDGYSVAYGISSLKYLV